MAPVMNASIVGYVAGDKLDVLRVVPSIPTGRTVVKAWMTVKNLATDADPGVMQKIITSTPVAGVGQITAPGDGSGGQPVGTASFFFEFSSTDTATLGATQRYAYDIKMKLDDGSPATLEVGGPPIQGGLMFLQGVTRATS